MCVHTAVSSALSCEERLRTVPKGCFSVRNGSVKPREEGSAKQTQVMLLRRWSADDVAYRLIEIDLTLEPWLRRYSEKRCLKFIV